MTQRITRRGFLAGLAVGVVGVALGLRVYFSGDSATRKVERLVGIFHHRDSAARLGRFYLESAPQEADAARLYALIDLGRDAVGTDATARAHLEARIREDFADDDLVLVDGWLLSITEARLCALASLMQGSAPT